MKNTFGTAYKVSEKLKTANVDEYRALPFWSWNDKLEKEELVRQIQWMKSQGYGGFFMHARSGLQTEYLSDDWFDCIAACMEAGEREHMSCWAYDENGWPSGFVGGELLKDPENCDRYLTYVIGKYDNNALVSYLLDDDKLVRTSTGGQGEYLNVYEHISVSTADILNGEVTEKFLEKTHKEYVRRLKGKAGVLQGFFTDEPQYYRAAQPYTKMIKAYFKTEYGEDILDKLGLLFVEKEGYRQFRYRYWLGMQTLMLENFAKKVYDWCEENGKALTGHYVEERKLEFQVSCCGGIMPFYAYEHIPGIDHLGLREVYALEVKQVLSVAKQLGKKRVLGEFFAGAGWGVTPEKLKRVAEAAYVYGVNLLCQHLLPYSEHGQRKRDYPAHFSWANPWVREDYKSFNDYFARLGYLLGESEEPVSVAVFCPVRSIYLDFKREDFGKKEFSINISYLNLTEKLAAMNIPYHIVDETVMEGRAAVRDGVLTVGNCAYTHIIFPKTLTMGKNTEKLFNAFYTSGGKLLFTEDLPAYLEGEEYTYTFKTNTTIEEIRSAQPYTISPQTTSVRSTYRVIDGKAYIYAVNTGDTPCEVEFEGAFSAFEALDIETFRMEKLPTKLYFEAGQSYVLFPTDGRAERQPKAERLILQAPFTVKQASDNYLTLDRLEYSFDGIHYSEKLGYMGVFNELLARRYGGELYLRYTFEVEEIPKRIRLLSEDMRKISCELNGHPLTFTSRSDFEQKLYGADIAPYVQKGVNRVVMKIDFYESAQIYGVLFGDGVTEGLKNCLCYDTTIEACYLQGDFGVYAKDGFTRERELYVADEFVIGKRKTEICDMIQDGYPFFAGNVTLEKRFTADTLPKELEMVGEYCLSKLRINGIEVEKSYFGKVANIEKYVKAGENVAEITLFSGNRNLLGPHHLKEEPTVWVGMDAFELEDTWQNGKSNMEREAYVFAPFGLFEK